MLIILRRFSGTQKYDNVYGCRQKSRMKYINKITVFVELRCGWKDILFSVIFRINDCFAKFLNVSVSHFTILILDKCFTFLSNGGIFYKIKHLLGTFGIYCKFLKSALKTKKQKKQKFYYTLLSKSVEL